ncbi:MAG: hypothetical protein ACPG5P_06160, partial [Saprospiraceae bacterium]
MDSNLDFRKMLRDVSIQTFIKYYNIFEENYNISDNSVIHENFKKNNETWSHNSCNSRATKGKRIFKNNLQLKALMYIAYEAEENRLSSEIITQAKNLLEINHDLLQEVNRIKNKDSKSSFPEGAIVERIHLQR